MALIADIKMMETTMREIGFDPNKMPLGKLKKTTVMQGYRVLQELSTLIVGASAISGGGGGGSGGVSDPNAEEEERHRLAALAEAVVAVPPPAPISSASWYSLEPLSKPFPSGCTPPHAPPSPSSHPGSLERVLLDHPAYVRWRTGHAHEARGDR